MKAPAVLSFVALCIAAGLTGCGSVTSNIDFKPPAGWTGTPSLFGRMQMWMRDAGANRRSQVVMLIRGDNSSQVGPFGMNGQYGNLRIVKRSSVKICGNQTAEYALERGTDHGGARNTGPSYIESIDTMLDGSKYIAMYVRPSGVPADPRAEAAIRSLCPKH